MTKKQIKNALKNVGVKGFSKAVISLDGGWVVVGRRYGKLDNGNLELHNIDLKSEKLLIKL